jgi:hypothetical protein
MDQNDPQIKAQREQFIKAFQDIATASKESALAMKNLHAVSVKQIELMNKMIDSIDGLVGMMMAPKDGMRDVIDDLIIELQSARDDLRTFARGAGMQGVFEALMGGTKSRKR